MLVAEKRDGVRHVLKGVSRALLKQEAFPRNSGVSADGRHLLPVQQLSDELEPFIHEVTLLPGHFCSPAKGPIV